MIACKPTFPPYLNALLPQDQIFDAEDLEYVHKVTEDSESPPKKRIKTEKKIAENNKNQTDGNKDVQINETIKPEENVQQNWDIDNPYLAATKLPAKGE